MSKELMKNKLLSKYAALSAFGIGLFIIAHTITLPVISASTEKNTSQDSKESKALEQQIENATNVTAEQLVDKPNDYLNKTVKFTAKFFAFSNLALDYKPAFRSSRTYLSFLVLRPNSHTPFSELKLDMLIPKEKDPETKMLQTLKEGDQIEVVGRVFATPLDEPWVDVLRLKKLGGEKKASSDDKETADGKE